MVNGKKDLLVLDFDGVIADSINECLVIGYNAFSSFSKNKKIIKKLNELDDSLVKQATQLRNYIYDGADYVFIYLALNHDLTIQNQEAFNRFTDEHNRLREKFFTLFYQERERFLSQQLKYWIQLNPLYPGIREFLSNFADKSRLFIVSTKRIRYVHEILSANHLQLLSKNIFQATKEKNKRTILLDLLNKYRIDPSHFHFIDDQVETLIKVSDMGVHRYLALWGYNSPEQSKLAKLHAIQKLTLEEFFKLFQSLEIC